MTSTDVQSKKKALKIASELVPKCFCQFTARESDVKKEGPNKGRTFYACGTALFDGEKQYGGCGFFLFKGDAYVTCTVCNHAMQLFKNKLSSAKCINKNCQDYKGPSVTSPRVAALIEELGLKECDCSQPFAISERGNNVSLFCVKVNKGDGCKAKHGIQMLPGETPDHIVHF